MTWKLSDAGPGTERPKERYHYTECGLDNIYLLNGYSTEELDGEVYHFVNNPDMLHRVIGIDLARQPGTLSGKEIRFLRKELNLTQAELSIYFDVKALTVSRWEKGDPAIPRSAELLLRSLYLCEIKGTVDVCGLTKDLAEMDRPTRKTLLDFSLNGDEWTASRSAEGDELEPA